MQQFKDLISDYIVLVFVDRVKFLCHPLENSVHMMRLFMRELKDMSSVGLEDFVLIQLSKLMKEVLIENTIDPLSDFIKVLPFVRNLRIGKRKSLLFYLDDFVGKVNLAIAFYEHDFIEVPSLVGDVRRFSFHIWF